MTRAANKKIRNEHRRQSGMCEIDDFCADHEIEWQPVNDYQIRLFGKNKVDIFPTNKKYGVITPQGTQFGSYKKIEELSKYLF